jgi:microcystin-dependent protein
MDEYVGTIACFGFDYAPVGWLPCDGRLLQVSQYQVLFALLGNRYGGNGVQNFALPDLRGTFPIGFGNSAYGKSYTVGQHAGTDTNTLAVANLPKHDHALTAASLPVTGTIEATGVLKATTQTADSGVPAQGNMLSAVTDVGGSGAEVHIYKAASTAQNVNLGGVSVTATPHLQVNTAGVSTGTTGSNTPVNNMPPYLALNFCICVQGVYPSRS